MTEQEKEKVLHGLNSCGFCDGVPNICEVTECPYRGNKGWCVHELAHDAGMLIGGLMKEQEPVKPTWKNGYPLCGECDFKLHWIIEQNNYCPNCGRAVKWE